MLPHRRILFLAAAALVIAGLCGWRLANPRQPAVYDPNAIRDLRPAPAFQLHDQDSRIVNLEAFLHRHQIVLVFFDGDAGPDADPVLRELREFHPALDSQGVIVVAVSTTLPQQNRKVEQPFPFPLLSDVLALDGNSAHRKWGRLIEPNTIDQPPRTDPAVFVIDRAGLVEYEGNAPKPVTDPTKVVAELLSGS